MYVSVCMYVCMHACMHVCMYVCNYLCISFNHIYMCVCPKLYPRFAFTVLLASSEHHRILGGPSQAALAFLLTQGEVEIMSLGRLGNPRTKWTSICGSYTWQLKENLYKHRGFNLF